MGTRRTATIIAMAALLAGLAPAGARPSEAAQASGRLEIAAQVGPRASVRPDRSLVRLRPGEQVDVTVVVKARLAAGSAAAVILESGLVEVDGGDVTYRFAGVERRLGGSATLAWVRTSGVHALPLTLSLAPTARRPVVLPLRFRVQPGDTPVVAGRPTDGPTVVQP